MQPHDKYKTEIIWYDYRGGDDSVIECTFETRQEALDWIMRTRMGRGNPAAWINNEKVDL